MLRPTILALIALQVAASERVPGGSAETIASCRMDCMDMVTFQTDTTTSNHTYGSGPCPARSPSQMDRRR